MSAAVARGRHRLWDEPPWIIDDPFALVLVGPGSEEIAAASRAVARPEVTRQGHAGALVRARYVEDRLLAGDYDQYVILGAGLDSFARRRSDVCRRLRVFEVDHLRPKHGSAPAPRVWLRLSSRIPVSYPSTSRSRRWAPHSGSSGLAPPGRVSSCHTTRTSSSSTPSARSFSTKRLLYAQLWPAETTAAVFSALHAACTTWGLPIALYTDRAGWAFHTPRQAGPSPAPIPRRSAAPSSASAPSSRTPPPTPPAPSCPSTASISTRSCVSKRSAPSARTMSSPSSAWLSSWPSSWAGEPVLASV